MDTEYSHDIQKQIIERARIAGLHRPVRVERYEPGDELTFGVTGVADGSEADARVVVERFVGGGFAGQVYRVRIADIQPAGASAGGLETGAVCAMKILIPPSTFSRFFRNLVYWVGFQGPFQPQVNPAAARAGALWQKLIRRGAMARFGDARTVVDIHATFIDSNLGACGELSEWVEGRTWRLEVDDRIDLLRRWSRGEPVDERLLGSPEYRAKRVFMREFVTLLHDMGAPEFARQYEWSTCKSQPNCLKRKETEDAPDAGLVAVDFRAGLALLPFLPMSPGDFMLIGRGLMRGSLVQFDRGDVAKLERFIAANSDGFKDAAPLVEMLKAAERVYRRSTPDITHNPLRLLYSGPSWSTMIKSSIQGWQIRNIVDKGTARALSASKAKVFVFNFLGFVPLLGPFARRVWGQSSWRRHYGAILSSGSYLKRALRVKLLEKVAGWHRGGRVTDEKAITLADNPWRCTPHLPLAILPARLHRFLTDGAYAKDRLYYYLVRPFRLYFNAALLEEWLRDIVEEGRAEQLLDRDDAEVILAQIGEPYIQKYLKSLAVHVLTLPVTQIVSVIIAAIYVMTHPDMPRAQAYGIGLGIIALFQVVPISPGSLLRGLYVVYLVVRERNFKDYNIAVFLGFFKYIGYLAFPIQMAYRYPTLARFMAAHWASGAVHKVPVFGERGALLEHWVYGMFYNWPLTLRRRFKVRAAIRATLAPRYWHMGLCAVAAAVLFGITDAAYFNRFEHLPTLGQIWPVVVTLPLVCGIVATLGARGASFQKRVIGGALCGVAAGVLYTALSFALAGGSMTAGDVVIGLVWRAFVFAVLSTIGVLVTEILLPEPRAPLDEPVSLAQ